MNKTPKMTRAHFQLIADLIREVPSFIFYDNDSVKSHVPRAQLADWFAQGLQGTNPNFDRARFLAAAWRWD